MSSIFAYAGKSPCRDIILDSVSRLKGEGFELSGIAMKVGEKIETLKIKGRAEILGENAAQLSNEGCLGIGEAKPSHRCKPSGITAPPSSNEYFCAALDGCIENFDALRAWSENPFPIATDEDLLLAALTRLKDMAPLEIITSLTDALQGEPSFAFFSVKEDAIYARAGRRSLAVGICEDGVCLSSEAAAIIPYAKKYFIIRDGECVKLTAERATVYDKKLRKIKKTALTTNIPDINARGSLVPPRLSSLPFTVKDTVSAFVKDGTVDFESLKFSKRALSRIYRIIIAGSGEGFRAAVLSAYYIEALSDIPARAAESGELLNSGTLFEKETLLIAVSPSGEDKNTVACLKRAKQFGSMTLGITCSPFSSLKEECERIIALPNNATVGEGAYFPCALALSLFTLWLGNKCEIVSERYMNVAVKLSELLAGKISSALKPSSYNTESAKALLSRDNIFVTGTGADFAVSLEAAAQIRKNIKAPACALPCAELSGDCAPLISESLVILFVTNKEYISSSLYYARRFISLGAKTLIYTTANIENEMSGFDTVVPVTDSLPLFDTLTALTALEKTLDTAKDILASEESRQAG